MANFFEERVNLLLGSSGGQPANKDRAPVDVVLAEERLIGVVSLRLHVLLQVKWIDTEVFIVAECLKREVG